MQLFPAFRSQDANVVEFYANHVTTFSEIFGRSTANSRIVHLASDTLTTIGSRDVSYSAICEIADILPLRVAERSALDFAGEVAGDVAQLTRARAIGYNVLKLAKEACHGKFAY